ncbi:MAG: hypothetical protein COB76_01515 [Alphaproteobacteria bacterium]|nr:MAG: hypothetical protein COB76_01515 [Alphaproteobacteria bacterium]
MILTCPQCETKFSVPDNAITAEGRKVRCAKCKHEWHQLPVEEKVADNSSGPEIIRETQNGSKESMKAATIIAWVKSEIIDGVKPFAIGLSIVLIIFAVIQMMSSHLVIGQGLAFHDAALTREGEVLKISGEIVNSMNEDRGVPKIQITLLYEDVEGDSVVILPSKTILSAGESLTFSHEVTGDDWNVTDLNVRFLIDSEDEADGHEEDAHHVETKVEDDGENH